MTRKGRIDADVETMLWNIGWRWSYLFVGSAILGLILGIGIGGIGGGFLFLIFGLGGPGLAVAGLVHVRKNAEEVADQGIEMTGKAAMKLAQLGDLDIEKHTLVTEEGNRQPLLPKPTREVATLMVEDNLLLVHDSAVVRLPDLSVEVGESTEEFYYDQVINVNFDTFEGKREGGEFEVNMTGDYSKSWESTREPGDALSDVQSRIRAYKTQ